MMPLLRISGYFAIFLQHSLHFVGPTLSTISVWKHFFTGQRSLYAPRTRVSLFLIPNKNTILLSSHPNAPLPLQLHRTPLNRPPRVRIRTLSRPKTSGSHILLAPPLPTHCYIYA
ncbi:unnamed protein product [Sphenostylis stenocarpa]|uniref:Uncharacterized protein n=1 Tax=Sphenostylis stenocarpa TaxID=92480 RepID=A0AA86SL72_9FABA|nr:unnamed protein product [Sphenostylis stenocarpa]